MKRTSEPRAGKSYERSELDLDADSLLEQVSIRINACLDLRYERRSRMLCIQELFRLYDIFSKYRQPLAKVPRTFSPGSRPKVKRTKISPYQGTFWF